MILKGKCHFELHYQDYCISYIIGNCSIDYGSFSWSTTCKSDSELAGIYGKLSSNHGGVTRVLIIFRNTMWEVFEGVVRWKNEKSVPVFKSLVWCMLRTGKEEISLFRRKSILFSY